MPGGVTVTVRADFSGTAYAGSPTWTDITGWVLSSSEDPGGGPMTGSWGRQDQASSVEAGTCTVILNNADGRFTPGRATLLTGGANPYYPNVRRHVRMRVTITDGSTIVALADGYVDSWTVTPAVSGPSTATVEITDEFGRMQAQGAATDLRGYHAEEAMLDHPTAFYLWDGSSESGGTGDLTATQPALVPHVVGTGGSYDLSSDGVVLAGAGVNGAYLRARLSGLDASWAGVYEVWFSTTVAQLQTIFSFNGIPIIFMGATGQVGGWAGRSGQIVTVNSYNDGALHYARLDTRTSPAFWTLTVDNESQTAINLGALPILADSSPILRVGSTNGKADFFYGTIRRLIAMYPALPTRDTRTAGTTNFAGETTAARLARLLAYRPTLGGSVLGSTYGLMGSGDCAGQTLAEALLEVATVEMTTLDTRGSLILHGRSRTYNPTTTVTLDASLGQVDSPTTYVDDTSRFVNDVTVTRTNGADQRFYSAASVTADGEATSSLTANVYTDPQALDMAAWAVELGTLEQLAPPNLSVDLYAKNSTALTMAVCGLRALDVVTATNLPGPAPSSSMSLVVQGGSFSVGASEFTVSLNTSPTPPTTLRADATADAFTKLDNGLTIGA